MVQEPSNFAMVLEFMPGGALDGYLRKLEENNEKLNDTQTFKIVRGTARGMQHLAEHRLVHRDMAARNVLVRLQYLKLFFLLVNLFLFQLDQELEPKIADFGFTRVVGDAGEGKTTSNIGPIKYVPSNDCVTPIYPPLQMDEP